MSELLSKSFSDLKVVRSRLCSLIATNILKKVTAPQIQIALPRLTTDGRACFYGYDVGMDWLIDYATKNWRWDPNDESRLGDLSKIGAGMILLREHSGIRRLEIESALKDHAAPSDTVTIQGSRHNEPEVPILSIFSNEGPSFKRRPSQEQIDRLSQIIGKQPRWWIDYEDPRSY